MADETVGDQPLGTTPAYLLGENALGTTEKYPPSAIGGLGPGFTSLTLGAPASVYNRSNVCAAAETFTLAAGDRIEIEAYLWRAVGTADSTAIYIGDGSTTGYALWLGSTTSVELYRITGGSTYTSLGGQDGVGSAKNGLYHLRLMINIVGSSDNVLWAEVEGAGPTAARADTNINLVGTKTLHFRTPDRTKCYARARKL